VSDLRWNAVLVVTTEVDNAVLALVATTDVTGGDAPCCVTATGLWQRPQQRLLGSRARDLGKVCYRSEPRRPGVVGLYLRIPIASIRLADVGKDVDGARVQGDDGALGVLALAQAESGAAGLAD
jgi:hypothetical protein